MTPELAILIPLGWRTAHMKRVYLSARETKPDATIVFIVSATDDPVVETGIIDSPWERTQIVIADWPTGVPGDYAKKINLGFRETVEPLVFLGADDIAFHPGWFEAARTKLGPSIGVVGTNDWCNGRVVQGLHSTHSLVTRRYVEDFGLIDQPGLVYFEGYYHDYCQPSDAPIWMADATFRALGDVRPGDALVGWERARAGVMTLNALCESIVLSVRERVAPLVRVEMESGRVIRCTPDHRWYNAAWTPATPHDVQWVTPRVGRQLLHVIDEPAPVLPELERTAGWLAGVYDGEGSRVQIAQSADHNPEVHAAIGAALAKLDLSYTESPSINAYTITGGRQGYLDFLLRVEPVKRAGLVEAILGGRANGTTRNRWGARRFGQRDRIVGVGRVGEGTVLSMTTTTGNYVGQGYASKNCDDELVQTAMKRGAYAHAHDAIVEHLHPNVRKSPDDRTYRHGRSTSRLGRRVYLRRKRLWTTP